MEHQAHNPSEPDKLKGTEPPFAVPDGYFEAFTDRLMDRIAQDEDEVHTQQPKVSILVTLKPYLSIAAVFALVALGYNIFLKTLDVQPMSAPPTAAQAWDAYIQQLDIDESILVESFSGNRDQDRTTDPNDAEIMNYLAETDLEESLILSELY